MNTHEAKQRRGDAKGLIGGLSFAHLATNLSELPFRLGYSKFAESATTATLHLGCSSTNHRRFASRTLPVLLLRRIPYV